MSFLFLLVLLWNIAQIAGLIRMWEKVRSGYRVKRRLLFVNGGKSDTNYHGTQGKGERWNRQTVKGWKLSLVILETFERIVPGRRLILYYPDGSWRHWDVFLAPTRNEVCQ